MLDCIKLECLQRNTTFVPTSIPLDLEMSTHLAFRLCFQSIEIKVCCIHLRQSWQRKINEVGLKTAKKQTQGL